MHTYSSVSKAQTPLQKTTFLGPTVPCAFHLTCLTTRTISPPRHLLTSCGIILDVCSVPWPCSLFVFPVLALFSLCISESLSPFLSPCPPPLSGFGESVTKGLREFFSPLPAVADLSSLYFRVFLFLGVSLCLPFLRCPGTALA